MELDLPCQYKVYTDPRRESYSFKTSSQASYEVVFQDNSQIIQGTPIADVPLYSIIISKTLDGSGGKDDKIVETVESLISYFFEINPDRILMYQCDSDDGRELVRYRMFRKWFELASSKKNFIRIEDEIESDNSKYHICLLHLVANPLDSQVIQDSFDNIIEELRQEK